jgi:predicted N-acetyltransferase YhbS
MNWGLEHADRLGLETFIEATDLGKPVYEKFGFRVMEHHSLHAPEKPEGVKVEEWRALEGKVLPFEWWSMVKDAKKIE